MLEREPKTQDSQIYKYHDVIPFGLKSEKAQFGKSQRGGENKKDKRGKENGGDKKGGGGNCGNKVNQVERESSGSEASIYHYIIY